MFSRPKPVRARRHDALIWTTALVLLGIGSVIVLGQSVLNGMSDRRGANIDNRTWVFAQLEVDFLKYENALFAAADRPEPTPTQMRDIRRLFDIYYSRVDTVDSQRDLFGTGVTDEAEIVRAIDHAVLHRDATALIVDELTAPTRDDVAALLVRTREIGETIRNISTSALMKLTSQHAAARREVETEVRRFLLLAAIQILILSIFMMIAMRLNRRLRQRSDESERSGASFKTIVDSSLDGIALVASDGRIIRYNAAAASIFGCHDNSALGMQIGAFLPTAGQQRRFAADPVAFMRSGVDNILQRGKFRAALKTKAGMLLRVELAVAQYRDWGNETITIAFIRNISREVSRELELRQARDEALRAMAAKGRFLNMMSHEMKTPLHGVIAALDLISDTARNADERENMQIARDSAAAALAQVEDVLAISGRAIHPSDAQPLHPFDVVDVVKLVVRQARLKARGKNVSVRSRIEGVSGNPVLMGRREAFSRAITNLVDNGVKFTREGHVDVSLRFHGDGAARRLVVVVSDTGTGIAKEAQNLMFEDFRTVAEGAALADVGNGLGLGIARRAIEVMDGKLELTSRPGEGTRFSFEIEAPTAIGSANAPRTPPLPMVPAHSRQAAKYALVVDDHMPNRTLMTKMLDRLGYRAISVGDGERAILAASRRRFDIILMDIQMPGLDGLETTRRIRSGGPSRQSPVLGVTANPSSHDMDTFLSAGLCGVLGKPITTEQLGGRIAQLLECDRCEQTQPLAADSLHLSLQSENLSLLAKNMSTEELNEWLSNALAGIQDALVSEAVTEVGIRKVHNAAGTTAFLGMTELHTMLCDLENAMRAQDLIAVDICRQEVSRLTCPPRLPHS